MELATHAPSPNSKDATTAKGQATSAETAQKSNKIQTPQIGGKTAKAEIHVSKTELKDHVHLETTEIEIRGEGTHHELHSEITAMRMSRNPTPH